MVGNLAGCQWHYAENFVIFCSVVNEFDKDDASSITILQDVFQYSNELKVIKTDLAYIRANFSFLSQSITKLEMTTNLLSKTVKEINYIQDKLKKSMARKLMQ
jgi:lipopolysaccharide biosynthesis protein